MYGGKAFFSAFALTAAVMLQGCGGGSDSTEPAPPPPTTPVAQTGDFELIAGTLDATAPAGAPRYQNGPALGVNLSVSAASQCPVVPSAENTCYDSTMMTVGANGHIYLLKGRSGFLNGGTPQYTNVSEMDLVEFDPSTGLMQVQQIPSHPDLAQLPGPPYSYVAPALTEVFTPSSFAVASDGSVLIGDGAIYRGGFLETQPNRNQPGYGFGIWRFKNGVLSKLAGFDTPSSSYDPLQQGQDGKGGAASFGSIDRLCAGPDGTVFISDNLVARKVLPDGTVQTIGDIAGWFGGMNTQYSTLICATNQRAITRVAEGGARFFGELGSGQLLGGADNGNLMDFDWFLVDLLYGFGDGLAINRWSDPNTPSSAPDQLISIADLKTGTVAAPWIRYRYRDASTWPAPDPYFQLETMPYAVPSPQIVIDNNDMAYLYSGNALLRYPLQKLQAN